MRIQNYCLLYNSTSICSLIYIDKFMKFKNNSLMYYNFHGILFAAIFSSIKYNENIFYNNKYYN